MHKSRREQFFIEQKLRLGLVGNTEIKIWVDYEQFLRVFFSCFHRYKSDICCWILNIFRLFFKIWVYFQAYKNSYSQESFWKHEKNLKLKISVSEKKNSAPTPKLNFGFGFRYWTWFRSYTARLMYNDFAKKLSKSEGCVSIGNVRPDTE